jgi:hypothetical protein
VVLNRSQGANGAVALAIVAALSVSTIATPPEPSAYPQKPLNSKPSGGVHCESRAYKREPPQSVSSVLPPSVTRSAYSLATIATRGPTLLIWARARRFLRLGDLLDNQRRRWSSSPPRTSTTRKVLGPSGIVSPGRQLGTAVAKVGASAGTPSAVSSLNRKPAIRALLRGRTASWSLRRRPCHRRGLLRLLIVRPDCRRVPGR